MEYICPLFREFLLLIRLSPWNFSSRCLRLIVIIIIRLATTLRWSCYICVYSYSVSYIANLFSCTKRSSQSVWACYIYRTTISWECKLSWRNLYPSVFFVIREFFRPSWLGPCYFSCRCIKLVIVVIICFATTLWILTWIWFYNYSVSYVSYFLFCSITTS